MMNVTKRLSVVALFLLITSQAFATTISDLQKEGRFKVEASLSSDGAVSIGEQVTVKIELSTDRWFTKGTRLGILQMPDAVALQRNKFATNYTSRSDGVTWSNQIWELTVYPQLSGEYIIPPLPIEVSVSASANEQVKGVVLTKALKFNAELPNGLITEEMPWVAASEFSIEQKLSVNDGDMLEVGDSIQRTIKLYGADTSSMLFPNLNLGEIKGTKAYPSPIENKDSSSRGDYRGERLVEISYIVQESGSLVVPEFEFWWWDINSDELKHISIPSVQLESKHTPLTWVKANKQFLLILVGVAMAFVASFKYLVRGCSKVYNSDLVSFHRSLLKGDWGKSNKFLYKKLFKETGSYSFEESGANLNGISDWESAYMKDGKPHKASVFRGLWKKVRLRG